MAIAAVAARLHQAERPARSRVDWQWVAVAAPAVALGVLAWRVRWMSDDGFIHLRVVQQLVDGHGPVFNAGERVEASTSPLWVALLALVTPLTAVALPWKAVLLGIGLSMLGVVAAGRAAVRLARPAGAADGVVLPLGILVLLVLRPFWEFASSGMETGLTFAWLGTSSWWCARRVAGPVPGRRAELAGAVLVGLGVVIRPDLILFSLAYGGVVVAAAWPSSWRRRVGVLAAMVAVPLLYQVFRMGYYAMLVPNTALAKEAGTAQWGRGWHYLWDFVRPYGLVLPVVVVVAIAATQTRADLVGGERLRAAARIAPLMAALLHALYFVRAGGDFMHARLLLPSLFGLVAPVGVVVPSRLSRRSLAPAVVVAWALVCATTLRTDLSLGTGFFSADSVIMDERAHWVAAWKIDPPVRGDLAVDREVVGTMPIPGEATFVPGWTPTVQLELRPGFPADSAMMAGSVGLWSYVWGTDVYVMDTMSLAQPVGSHFEDLNGERPGHQKPVGSVWFVADVTDELQLIDTEGRVVASPSATEYARRALGCGQLGEYLHDIREPLTPRRFVGNILDSFANTTFRFSADPARAEDQLCD